VDDRTEEGTLMSTWIMHRAIATLLGAALLLPATTSVATQHAAARGVAFCKGRPATIVGTPSGDRIEGTNVRDVIAARGGNDHVEGKGGRDLICGGRGTDDLEGNHGRDRIFGGKGVGDEATGGRGSDLCRAEETRSCER
jgi:Ca2+-binding RTX toxin-like protein